MTEVGKERDEKKRAGFRVGSGSVVRIRGSGSVPLPISQGSTTLVPDREVKMCTNRCVPGGTL
jgi:hypothetical protein